MSNPCQLSDGRQGYMTQMGAIKQAYYSKEVAHWNNVLFGAKTDPYDYSKLWIDIRVCYNIN